MILFVWLKNGRQCEINSEHSTEKKVWIGPTDSAYADRHLNDGG
jgi:hypothetical protein